jgi:hypothetical protein
MNWVRFTFLCVLALLAAVSRIAPHPYNFAPLTAVALFAGATFSAGLAAVLVPFAALMLSDTLLHLSYLAGWQPNWGFYPGQWIVYASLLITIGVGRVIRTRRNFGTVLGGTLLSSFLFFLITNLIWVHGASSLYPATIQGQLQSYHAGLFFFRYTLAGDLFYSSLLFGALAFAEARYPALRSSENPPRGTPPVD